MIYPNFLLVDKLSHFFLPLNMVSFKTLDKTFADAYSGEVFITANVKGSQNVL